MAKLLVRLAGWSGDSSWQQDVLPSLSTRLDAHCHTIVAGVHVALQVRVLALDRQDGLPQHPLSATAGVAVGVEEGDRALLPLKAMVHREGGVRWLIWRYRPGGGNGGGKSSIVPSLTYKQLMSLFCQQPKKCIIAKMNPGIVREGLSCRKGGKRCNRLVVLSTQRLSCDAKNKYQPKPAGKETRASNGISVLHQGGE